MMVNDNLDDALQELASRGTQGAPARVEVVLLRAFRRKRLVRRVKIWTSMAAVGAVAAAGAILLTIPQAPSQKRIGDAATRALPLSISQPNPTVTAVNPSRPKGRARKTRLATEVATSFYPLPDADVSPVDEAAIVRVQLPRSAMRLVGLPVNEDRVDERIQADVVVGQDGLARAVRFVQ